MNYRAALVLFLTPAISVELLTGNTPLAQYVNPLTFVILNIVYGGALLLIRETVVRWRKGFSSVLILAAGYGMVNEAIGTKGFFDPHFYAVMQFGLDGFGRALGINVPWALNISIFHAVFSILVPFVLVGAVFPGSGRWIGDKPYAALIAGLAAVSLFAFKVFSGPPSYYHYDEGPGPLLLIVALIVADIWAAWKMPAMEFSKWDICPGSISLYLFGLAYFLSFLILPGIVRKLDSPMLYEGFLLLIFVALPVLLIFKLPAPTPRGKVALAAGLLSPITIASILHGGFVPAAAVSALVATAWVKTGEMPSRNDEI